MEIEIPCIHTPALAVRTNTKMSGSWNHIMDLSCVPFLFVFYIIVKRISKTKSMTHWVAHGGSLNSKNDESRFPNFLQTRDNDQTS